MAWKWTGDLVGGDGNSFFQWSLLQNAMGLLLGGDWNHGILNDVPFRKGNGMSSSQLTKSIMFQRGRYTTN
jgi:hypothetical protein